MVVPRLSPSDSTHPEMLVVAPTPAPKSATPPIIPNVRAMTEREWAENAKKLGVSSRAVPVWVFVLTGTLIMAFVLQVNRASFWPPLVCLAIGAGMSAVLIVRDMRANSAYSLLKGLGLAFALMLLIPVMAVGILFIGCALACH